MNLSCIEECISTYISCFPSREDTQLELEDSEEVNIETLALESDTEDSFCRSFFVKMNNSIFKGEYLNPDFKTKLDEFENILLPNKLLSNSLRIIFRNLRQLLMMVENKMARPDDNFLFSTLSPLNLDISENVFLEYFNNFSLSLVLIDHSLIISSRNLSDIALLRERIGKNRQIDNEELKLTFDKLRSKCSLLLYKQSYKSEASRYILDFKENDISNMSLEDDFNRYFFDNHRYIYDCFTLLDQFRCYKNYFDSEQFSTLGFIIKANYYKKKSNNESALESLISKFSTYYSKRIREDILPYDKYSLLSIKHYLNNCLFTIKLKRNDYLVSNLEYDINFITLFQIESGMKNYHPYSKALEFLSKILNSEELLKFSLEEINKISTLYSDLLALYKESIDWCIQMKFIPFQLEYKDCCPVDGIFIASSCAEPLNISRLNESYRTFRDMKAVASLAKWNIVTKTEIAAVNESILNTKEGIEKERTKILQYSAMFVAIITFLFGSLPLFSVAKMETVDLLKNIVSLGIVLLFFMLIMYVITTDKIDKKKMIIISITICLCFALLLLLSHEAIIFGFILSI